MASIIERGPFQFQALVRRKGYPTQTKTFETKREAKAWASVIESEMVRGAFTDRREAEQTRLCDALERYRREVTQFKRCPKREENRIQAWMANPLTKRSLASLRSTDFALYRDERLNTVGGNTTRLELAVISHLFTIARKEWSIPVDNPIKNIRMPKLPPARDRRPEGDEEARLIVACKAEKHGIWLSTAVQLAIETGMREGELATLEWRQVNLEKKIVRLEKTKNGDSRSVPLSNQAVELLKRLPRAVNCSVLPSFGSGEALSRAFGKARDKTGIEDFHFHDLRHEAASRFAPHMTAQTLAKVMGWKTIQMAMRYYNPTDEELVHAIDVASQKRAISLFS